MAQSPATATGLDAPIRTWGRVAFGVGIAIQLALCVVLRDRYGTPWNPMTLWSLDRLAYWVPFLHPVVGAFLLGASCLGRRVSRLSLLWWCIAWVIAVPPIMILGVVAAGLGHPVP